MSSHSLSLHVGLLMVGAVVAGRAWLSDGEADEAAVVQIWEGTSEAVERIEYTSEDRSLLLEAKRDAAGTYYVGKVEREKPERPNPHGPEDPPADEPDAARERETLRFVAVGDAANLAEQLAPLQAARSLGALTPERQKEFGLGADTAPRLSVTIAGKTHELFLGDKTPGGNDWYARSPDGAAYVLDGQIARDIESAENRLMERELNDWGDEDASGVKVTVGEQVRELVRLPEKKDAWADAQTIDQQDETASNWMGKLGRLRIVEYFEQPEPPPESVFKVEFFDSADKRLGSIEVGSRSSATEEGKLEFLARSEHTRWWGKVLSSTAEQLTQDVGGLVQP
jgi:hypothetical protein